MKVHTMREWLKRALHTLQVERGEERLVALLLLHSFFIGMTVIFFETVAYSTFLTRYEGASGILPLVYMSASAITIVVGVIYARIERWMSFRQLLTVNLITVMLALILFRRLFEVTDNPFPAIIAVIGFDVLWVLQSLEFWGLAGRVFNVRQGKRLFGLIGSGEVMALVLGGAIVPTLLRFMPALNLYFFAIAGVALSLLMMLYITRSHLATPKPVAAVIDETLPPQPREQERQQEREKEDRTPAQMLRDRYLLLIFVLAAITIFTLYFTDNAFFDTAERRYANADELAGFLGFFLSLAGLAQLFVRAILSGWVLSRFGVMAGLLLLPVALALSSAGALAANEFGAGLTVVFWLVVLVKLLDRSLRYSLNKAAQLVLYQPFSPKERVWAQTAAESVIEPIAGISSGAVLLVLNQALHFGTHELLFIMMVIIVFWIGVVIYLNREYTTALARALNRRIIGGQTLSFRDSSSIAVLRRTLNSEHPGEVIYALNTLENIGHPTFDDFLSDLLNHRAQAVRLVVLDKFSKRAKPHYKAKLIACLPFEPVPELKQRMLRVLSELGETDALLPYLDDPDRVTQFGAIVGLLRHKHGEAAGKLHAYAASPLAADRVFAADIIGEADGVMGDETDTLLSQFLNEEEPSVRRAATTAVGKIKHPTLYPLIIENLENTHNGLNAAISALSDVGEGILPLLEATFVKPEQPRHVLIRILRIMTNIKGESVRDWLAQHSTHPDEFVRYYILDALRTCDYHAPPTQTSEIHQRVLFEVKEAAWNLAAIIEMQAEPRAVLMIRALEQELRLTRERILLLLSFLYDVHSLKSVQANYAHPAKEKRAYAMEILDTLLPKDIKSVVMALMDHGTPAQQLKGLSDFFPQSHLPVITRLRSIVIGEYAEIHPWTKACAFYTLAELRAKEVSPDIAAVIFGETDVIVRETALWALYQLNPVLYNLYNRSIEDMKSNSGRSSLARSTIVTAAGIEKEIRGQGRMLLMVEKVIILRTVSIFSDTPEDYLAEIAMVLAEVEVEPDETIIRKGEAGNCLYIIASGKVRVHDGERTFAELGEREVVGELALLDAEPRTANVTALEKTMLLKLDQDAFFELIANNPDVVRGVMRVLTRRLRAAMVKN